MVLQLKVDEVSSPSTLNLSYSTVTFKSTIGATQLQYVYAQTLLHKHKYQVHSKQSTVYNICVQQTVRTYKILMHGFIEM